MKERNYGIEFIRIISMLMVVLLHILGHGGALSSVDSNSMKYWIMWFLEISSYGAVNIYALITGYVMYSSRVRISRLILLWLQTFFYMLVLSTMMFFIFPETLSKWEILNIIFPIGRKVYWYLSAYVGLYLFIPIILESLKQLRFKYLTLLIFAFVVVFSIEPTLLLTDPYVTFGGYSVLWLLILFIIGAYIKKYNIAKKIKAKQAMIGFVFMNLITFFWKFLIEIKFTNAIKYKDLFISYTSPTILLAAILFLIFGIHLKINSKFIFLVTTVSRATLGVYIFHLHPLIWNYVVKDCAISFVHLNIVYCFIKIFGSTFIIFVIGIIIDSIRLWFFNKIKIDKFVIYLENQIIKML